MADLIKWAIWFLVLGWVAFPPLFHFFPKSAERGFSISKIFGLLIWGYLYWAGNIFGIISNSLWGAVLAFLVALAFSLFFFLKNRKEIENWLRSNHKIILFYEVLFLAAFIGWSLVRAANPEIIGTEKPTELAFISGIFRSPGFPPNDPWLSGYSISYNYFGYILVAMLMHLLGSSSGTAFNLFIALIFALTAVSSSGVLFNLIGSLDKRDAKEKKSPQAKHKALAFSLLAPLLILLVSNGVGLLEVMHSRGLFWELEGGGAAQSPFWEWLDIQELNQSPSPPFDWTPSRAEGTWWWRASRVLQDYTLDGQSKEIIDEFPFFSFLLADLHPHVISLPFVVMSIYLCFYLFVSAGSGDLIHSNIRQTIQTPFFWLVCLVFGSLIFINTWDFPIYFLLLCLSLVISSYSKTKSLKVALKNLLPFIAAVGVGCIGLFSPFLLGLSSQASSFIPSLIFRTRGVHYLVMFLPHVVFILLFLIHSGSIWKRTDLLKKFVVVSAFFLFFFLLSLAHVALLEAAPRLLTPLMGRDQDAQTWYVPLFGLLRIFSAQNSRELILAAISRLLGDPWVLMVQALIIACAWFYFSRKEDGDERTESINHQPARLFIYILLTVAALLSAFPELFYLRDQFGWRMNTIFKFYFQVWVLLSITSSFVLYDVLHSDRLIWRRLGLGLSVLTLAVSLIYPFFALRDKTNSFRDMEWSLDGNRYFEWFQPYDYQAAQFLVNLPYGVISEAVGGSYSIYGHGRISRLSGYPTVLGWPGHEVQWRGGMDEIGTRERDIQTLYTTTDWQEAGAIMDLYQIDYIVVGDLERRTYAVHEDKFRLNLAPVFERAEIIIYSNN